MNFFATYAYSRLYCRIIHKATILKPRGNNESHLNVYFYRQEGCSGAIGHSAFHAQAA